MFLLGTIIFCCLGNSLMVRTMHLSNATMQFNNVQYDTMRYILHVYVNSTNTYYILNYSCLGTVLRFGKNLLRVST